MALKECKECKKEVSSTAKTCPHCGVKNPAITGKDKAKGCLGLFIAVIIIATILGSCSEDTQEETTPQPTTKNSNLELVEPVQTSSEIPEINDQNINGLIVEATNFYIENFMILIKNYQAHANKDRSVFINWRSNEWVPEYDKRKQYFDDILDNNRKYLFSNGYQPIFNALSNLPLISLDIMKAIRESDKKHLENAKAKFIKYAKPLNSIVESHNLQDQIITPN